MMYFVRELRFVAAACFAAAIIVMSTTVRPAQAQKPDQELVIENNSGHLVKLPGRAVSILVANPDIADVQAPAVDTIMIFGKKPGRTSIYALAAGGQSLAAYSVRIIHELADLRQLLAAQIPDASIIVTSTPLGLVLSGTAPNPATAQRARDLARRFMNKDDELTDNISVTGSTQVNLRVRVAEVSRNAVKRLGFSWGSIWSNGSFLIGLLTGRPLALNATTGAATAITAGTLSGFTASPSFGTASESPGTLGGGIAGANYSVNQVLDLLATEGLVTILAEPNITAISGEQSSFLAGGEFPIPVNTTNNLIGIEFKKFGVSVEFNPTVLSRDRISMKVRPEVSELSERGSITLGNVRIPGLAVRRAETTIELASGQSFAMAGLFSNNMNLEASRTPGLGDLPILGSLFRSDRFQNNESELVIIVTPYIVRPTAGQLASPHEGLKLSPDLERFTSGRNHRPGIKQGTSGPVGADGLKLGGDAGYMME
jgi:pilus assembly protein CpaC